MTVNRPVTVLVTDIVHGEQNSPGRCAVAHAIKRQYPELKYINVGRHSIGYSNPQEGLRYEISTPKPVAKFLTSFDKGYHQGTDPNTWILPSFEIRENEAETKPMARASTRTWASTKNYKDPTVERRVYRSVRRYT